MEVLWIVLTLMLIGLLWVAAVVFGRDSRDGNDWFRRPRDHDRLFHGGH